MERTAPGRNPAADAWFLLLAAVVLRIVDIFILRLDEVWAKIFLSKVLGFVLILSYLALTGRALCTIGLHADGLSGALALRPGTAAIFALWLVVGHCRRPVGLAPACSGRKPRGLD